MGSIHAFLQNINPLKKMENNSKAEYIIQKILAFLIIYLVSAVVVEGIIILIFTAMGYDLLHGIMPTGDMFDLLPLFGFAGFGVFTIFYMKMIEKKRLSEIKVVINRKFFWHFFINFIFGGILVGFVIFILWIGGYFEFSMIGKPSITVLFMGLLAYGIQGMAEEIMCRGFLLHTLWERTGRNCAVILSTIGFILPHLPSLSWNDGGLVLIEGINLVQISVLFSLAMIKDDTIAPAFGIHIGWNYVLAYVFGLQVSGTDGRAFLIQFASKGGHSYITGGNYGIEASMVLIPILFILNVIYFGRINRKQEKMEFHKKLYELRKKNGLSQEELAGKLNVTRQTISKWELGESTPDMEKLVMLGDYFNISLDELVLGKTIGESNNSKENGEEKNLHVCQKMVTEKNRNRARRGLKIMGIVLGVFFLIDIISLIFCLVLYGILG